MSRHIGITVVLSVLLIRTETVFLDGFKNWFDHNSGHSSSYNSHSQDVSHTGGDTDGSSRCDHVSDRDHIGQLVNYWHSRGDNAAVMKVYEWTVTHERLLHAQVLGKRAGYSVYWEAYTYNQPDIRHIEELIKVKINSACRKELIHYIEYLMSNVKTTKQTTQHHTREPSTTKARTTTQVRSTTTRPTTTIHHKTTTIPTSTTKATVKLQKTTPTTTTSMPTTTTPKTTTTSRTTTKVQPKTTTPMLTLKSTTTGRPKLTSVKDCDAKTFVLALAKGAKLQHPMAGLCTDGSHSQSEALLLDTCETPDPKTWKQGLNVVQNCQDLPTYTPVGVFTFGHYVMDGNSLSGIFLECTQDGFKMALQLCGQEPKVYEIKSTSAISRENARNYYVIDW